MTTIALIPVKELSRAKARLAPVLDDSGRRELALALFRDALHAALACRALDGVVVATPDAEAASIAAKAGAEVLHEPGGLNQALTSAAEKLARRGVTRLVVLAADLALASVDGITAIVKADADVVVVPSTDAGTNALALPPGAIAFQFGPDSAQRHLKAAQEAGLRALRLDIAALSMDIDTPEDLALLRATVEAGTGVGEHTRAALGRLGLISAAASRGG